MIRTTLSRTIESSNFSWLIDVSELSDLVVRIEKLENQVDLILQRNLKVEAEKAWETSLFRRLVILLLTYLLTSLVFWLLGVYRYFLNAIIPSLGYLLSIQTLPIIKKWWIERRTRSIN